MRPAQHRAMPDSPRPTLLPSRAISTLTARGPSHPIPIRMWSATTAPGDDSPAFALVGAYVEPPAGIEPATPSLPWNHQEPLCGSPFSQVGLDRRGGRYRFFFDEVMRSLPSGVLGAVGALQSLQESRDAQLVRHPAARRSGDLAVDVEHVEKGVSPCRGSGAPPTGPTPCRWLPGSRKLQRLKVAVVEACGEGFDLDLAVATQSQPRSGALLDEGESLERRSRACRPERGR